MRATLSRLAVKYLDLAVSSSFMAVVFALVTRLVNHFL